MKIEEGFCINAIKLHELYFENLHAEKDVAREIIKMIEDNFISYEKWKKEFISCALSARGWVILAYDLNDGRLHNYISDIHNQGIVLGTIPLIVLDMYEHAYFIDFGTDKKSYIDWFLSSINWEIVEERLGKI